jgi:hypothetical protein
VSDRNVSPDSGQHWAGEGAWPAAPGVHRIPLPLPTDGLRAVNVYAIETDEGLTLVDGGWAIEAGRAALDKGLGSAPSGRRRRSRSDPQPQSSGAFSSSPGFS